MFCKNCGSQLSDEEKFCTNCGAKVEREEVVITQEQSEVVENNVNPIQSGDKSDNNTSNSFEQSKKKGNDFIAVMGIIIVIAIAATLIAIATKLISKTSKKNNNLGSLNTNKGGLNTNIESLDTEDTSDKKDSSSQNISEYDGGEITIKEYDVYYKLFYSYLKDYGYEGDYVADLILYKAVNDELIYNDAVKAGYTLTEDEKAEIEETFSDEEYLSYFSSHECDIDTLREIYERDYIIQKYVDTLSEEENDELYGTEVTEEKTRINEDVLEEYLNSVKDFRDSVNSQE